MPVKYTYSGLTSHTISWGKQWSENSMLNVPNSMTIFSSLLLYSFVMFISRSKAKGAVTGGIRVKYTNIRICNLARTLGNA